MKGKGLKEMNIWISMYRYSKRNQRISNRNRNRRVVAKKKVEYGARTTLDEASARLDAMKGVVRWFFISPSQTPRTENRSL